MRYQWSGYPPLLPRSIDDGRIPWEESMKSPWFGGVSDWLLARALVALGNLAGWALQRPRSWPRPIQILHKGGLRNNATLQSDNTLLTCTRRIPGRPPQVPDRITQPYQDEPGPSGAPQISPHQKNKPTARLPCMPPRSRVFFFFLTRRINNSKQGGRSLNQGGQSRLPCWRTDKREGPHNMSA
ncbi:hypothetical protein VUR80DRAFT_3798 [Thermomyces stellatus]